MFVTAETHANHIPAGAGFSPWLFSLTSVYFRAMFLDLSLTMASRVLAVFLVGHP